MREIPPQDVNIQDVFWSKRLEINASRAIFHQWQMLEASGCIDNFRIAAGEKEGLRQGWYFADSDATKWLDAASRIERNHHDERLTILINDFIRLLKKAQCPDGYLFTYNQIHFPGCRWVNLQIEHELYCHGHFIEAGVSHYEATQRQDLLGAARLAADLLIRHFLDAEPSQTPGHEEVEIALLRLWQVTGYDPYRELADHFLEGRGRTHFFGLSLIRQFANNGQREKQVGRERDKYQKEHSGKIEDRVPAANKAVKPPFSLARFYASALSGDYFQQNRPIREQKIPVGHAVRFGYLETAAAMHLQFHPDDELLTSMQSIWERMVARRMDVTGGLGALPDLEGFGSDYELAPETAYNETCAALASLLWNWQLTTLTGSAKYSDLFEWQLYNAALVGMGWQGDTYLYNNPTLCRGGINRQAWYAIPCCPSNLSRIFADLGKYIFSYDEKNIWVHQYIGYETPLISPPGLQIKMETGFPWQGRVKLIFTLPLAQEFTLRLRIPSWVGNAVILVNGIQQEFTLQPGHSGESTASGVDPQRAIYLPMARKWSSGDVLELDLEMPIQVRLPNPKVKAVRGRGAVTRGPLVYCLESSDNPNVDLFGSKIVQGGLKAVEEANLFDGITRLIGKTSEGQELIFIPYALWGNRGPSQMNVWVKIAENQEM
jgi:hypothetical protein